MRIEASQVAWPFRSVFRTSRGERLETRAVQVAVRDRHLAGHGEGVGVSYNGETIERMVRQLHELACAVGPEITRDALQLWLPPGGARNAVDCALWDLEAKRSGVRAWQLAGVRTVRPVVTARTISLDMPAAMAKVAADLHQFPVLKLKLGGEGDVERVSAVRAVRPDATLIVDANQAWTERELLAWPSEMERLGVALIEQPLPADADAALLDFRSPVPICADESCQTSQSLPALAGKYQYVNIKLDKTGGLTEALKLARAASGMGFGLMVGCMAGSSLSMAPAYIIAQLCDWVDLDGPLLASKDAPSGILYEGGTMHPPEAELWG